MTQRTQRIDELLRQEIGDLIAREVADPDVGFVTVTDVETTPDLRHARVWVSVIGQPEVRDASIRALQRAMPFIRAQLGRRLRLKRIPEFAVRLDESVERGARVLQLLHELEAGATPDELAGGESLPTPTRRHVQDDDAGDVGPGASEASGPRGSAEPPARDATPGDGPRRLRRPRRPGLGVPRRSSGGSGGHR